MIPWGYGLGILVGAIALFGFYMWNTPRDRSQDE